MALTLFEDTFVTVTEANTRLSGDLDWTGATIPQKEQALKDATNVLNELLWAGSAVVATQTLAWPRKELSYFDPSHNLIVEVAESEVPLRLRKATANLAAHYIKYPEAVDNYSASYERIKLGPLELEDTKSGRTIPRVPFNKVMKLVEPLLRGGNNNNWWRAN